MGRIRNKELFDLINKISQDEIELIEKKTKNKFQSMVWKLGIGLPLIVAIPLFIVSHIYKFQELFWIGFICLSISYISIIFNMLLEIYTEFGLIKKTFKDPFSLIIANAQRHALTDMVSYHNLKKFTLNELQYLNSQLCSERDAFSRRITLIIGSIEKVGLFPGILAMIIMMNKAPNQQTPWIISIAVGICILSFLSVGFLFSINRLERIIKLIELSIENKLEK